MTLNSDDAAGPVRRTVSIDPTASAALDAKADHLGIPIAEYLAMVLEAKAADLLAEQKESLKVAEQLRAANQTKAEAAAISRDLKEERGVERDHTLKVFQTIREQHSDLYRQAIGCETDRDAGDPKKRHALNLALGSISKRAAKAKVRLRPNGLPEKIRNIQGEFCASVTVLEPGDEVDDN
ncbi:hypothetical protein ACFOD4_19190 [Pseudoroseomonas globiformis]|uniref:Uncharacterized protein n=1 Tax=Teichococcus globiformis TaxID=2307229 RepID=A0ABV7G5R3_9PROT